MQDSPADITDAAGWTLTDIAALLGDWIISGFQPTLHFAAQSAGYLLLAGLLGLLVGRPAGAYVEILAVLGFGSLSLSTAMQLTALVGSTAQDCSTYLTAFVPVFGGVAAAGGQTSGALVYSGMFFAMSGFLCAVIRKLLLPVMQIYFCFSVCACLSSSAFFTFLLELAIGYSFLNLPTYYTPYMRLLKEKTGAAFCSPCDLS